jgi:hypothetical protein
LDLFDREIEFEYEKESFKYVIPEKKRTYTPDFFITTSSGKLLCIEFKGYLTAENRQKTLLVREHNPDIDLRFVFQSNNKISRKAKMRYGDWCDRHGFLWAVKAVPDEWLEE